MTLAYVHLVEVAREDGTYVFADLDDARAFEATVNAGSRQGYREEHAVADRDTTLKMIAEECEATEEATAASLESGCPITTYAWNKGEEAPYPDDLEAVEYVCYPFGSEEGDGQQPKRITLWVGLDPDVGAVNVDAGRVRLEAEGWQVTEWGAA